MKPHDHLTIAVTHADGVTVLVLEGEIDAFNADSLRESVTAVCELGVPMVLDMHQVTFMDSTGISALIDCSKLAQSRRSSVQIQRPSNRVRRLLSLTKLDEVFLLDDYDVDPVTVARHA